MRILRLGVAIASALAVAVWLGGLVALGAIAAPIVFSVVTMPQSADAMTMVFRRFDLVSMSCAAVALAAEATRAVARVPFARLDHARAAATVGAALLATYEGTSVSPRIAVLHMSGAVRGLGPAGLELSRLHDVAEACGKAELAMLVLVVALQVLTLTLRLTRDELPARSSR
jgi:uncharacterized membrane protein